MIIPPEKTRGALSYRFKRGSKLVDLPPLPPSPPVPPLSQIDGPFQLSEYLSLKVRHDPHDIKGLVEVPSDNAKAADRHVWIYEHLRRIPIDVTPLLTQLQLLCSHETCPEMKANEWQYLCVAHGGEGTDKCCAIDYILHTLDSTTALLNSSNYFPSRLQIPHASLTHFPSLFRRLSRIFSHAYFHHREAFATSEAETSLYARFAALCQRYELLGAGLLLIPPEGYEVVTPNDDSDDHNDTHDSSDEEPEHAGPGDTTTVLNEGGAVAQPADAEPAAPASVPIAPSTPGAPTEGKGDDSDKPASSRGAFSPNRWSGSPVQPPHKGKPAPAQASESLSPPSTRAALDGLDDSPKVEPKVESKVVQGKGRGTLSRGKAPRASVFAATGPDANASGTFSTSPPSADGPLSPSVLGMARKESVESAVFVGEGEKSAESAEGASVAAPALAPPLPVEQTATDTNADALADAPEDGPSEPPVAPTAPAAPATPAAPAPAAAPAAAPDAASAAAPAQTAPSEAAIPIQLDAAEPAAGADLSVSPKTATIPDILAEDTDACSGAKPIVNSPKVTKSELLPSPKSESLSISPKSATQPKRGGKNSRGAPRSPKRGKGKALKKESGSPVPVGED